MRDTSTGTESDFKSKTSRKKSKRSRSALRGGESSKRSRSNLRGETSRKNSVKVLRSPSRKNNERGVLSKRSNIIRPQPILRGLKDSR